jgi:hypothetical protein
MYNNEINLKEHQLSGWRTQRFTLLIPKLDIQHTVFNLTKVLLNDLISLLRQEFGMRSCL